MIIKGNVENMAREINSAIQEYLTKENKTETNINDVMDFLIEKGLFADEKKKKNKIAQLDSVLGELVRIGRENLVKGMRIETVKRKKVWYFDKV